MSNSDRPKKLLHILTELKNTPDQILDPFFYITSYGVVCGTLFYCFYEYFFASEFSIVSIAIHALTVCMIIGSISIYRRFRHYRKTMAGFVCFLISLEGLLGLYMPSRADYAIFGIIFLSLMAYTLINSRRGAITNIVIFLFLLSIIIFQSVGLIETVYPIRFLIQAVVAFFILSFFNGFGFLTVSRLFSQINEQKRRLSALLDNLPAGVVMADATGADISMVNPAVKQALGKTVNVGETIKKFCDELDLRRKGGEPLPCSENPLSVALSGNSRKIKDAHVIVDGKKMHLQLAGAPILDESGGRMGGVMVIENVTKEREVEEMRSSLVSLASHQLKNPLTNIRWTTESLIDGSLGTLSDDQKEAIESIESTTKGVIGLVGDLLSSSRIESGKLPMSRRDTEVVGIVHEALASLKSQVDKKYVGLDLSEMPKSLVLNVDPAGFKEAFTNLISNAIKYSRDGGTVEIGVSDYGEKDTLFVRDHGIGIPEEDQPQVFNQFFRAGNAKDAANGTGLGLHIAKSIIEANGGHVWFESEEGDGTTFYLQLDSASDKTANPRA